MVTDTEDGLAALRSEIAAFRAGFGHPDLLLSTFRAAAVLVPLTAEDRLYTSRYAGIAWICVFTAVRPLAAYLNARGTTPGAEHHFHTLRGHRLTDYATAQPDPTGIVIDPGGDTPLALPPRITDADGNTVGVL
ncbi:SseB family protein [Nocardia sp. alder85J]|uniref:SseB family protein n=1 Tax=Nocardia sp. alder85J TaxID=2862949 RepID=UPI001CD3AF58|nr:SseB family protein [Nocardia sp. alder85J]MCX4096253.1 SseB family protein [Nocardia sp. alder85J]